jgi:hypothetical protein
LDFRLWILLFLLHLPKFLPADGMMIHRYA